MQRPSPQARGRCNCGELPPHTRPTAIIMLLACLLCLAAPKTAAKSKPTPADPAKNRSAAGKPSIPVGKGEDQTAGKNRRCDALILAQGNLITGNHHVTVSQFGIKETYDGSGAITVASAPGWLVHTYNPRSGLYISQPLGSFTGYMHRDLTITTGRAMTGHKMEAVGTTDFLGYKARVFRTAASQTRAIEATFREGEIKSGEPASIVYTGSDQLKAPPQACALLCRAHGLDNTFGLPLQVKYKDAEHRERSFLLTTRIVKTKVSTDEFKLPAGLKQAKEAAMVFRNPDGIGAEQLMLLRSRD